MNLDGDLIVHAGASRGGKTLRARLDVKDAKRLIVWDVKGKWAEVDRCKAIYTRAALLAAVKAAGTGPARLAFISSNRQDFGYWAEAAFWWGRWGGERGIRSNVVAEETADVTSPSKAPEGFHKLLSQGLEFGITIHALTQRPSESDKTSIGNATLIRTWAAARDKDAKYIAEELRTTQAKVDALAPLEYLERDRKTRELRRFRAKTGSPFPKWVLVPL